MFTVGSVGQQTLGGYVWVTVVRVSVEHDQLTVSVGNRLSIGKHLG